MTLRSRLETTLPFLAEEWLKLAVVAAGVDVPSAVIVTIAVVVEAFGSSTLSVVPFVF